jgi:hypothetical protein
MNVTMARSDQALKAELKQTQTCKGEKGCEGQPAMSAEVWCPAAHKACDQTHLSQNWGQETTRAHNRLCSNMEFLEKLADRGNPYACPCHQAGTWLNLDMQ